ncbi:MAG: hypothetical protein Q7T30_00730 [Planctomycetota bacterium]|nr:hypothetical protein [Planctomycetota bacterium]
MTRATGFVLAATLAATIACGSSCSTTNGSTPQDAPLPGTVTQLHDVRDLVFPRAQVAPSTTDEPAKGWIQIADLVGNLKEATDPKYWEAEGTAIRLEQPGYLEATASPRMQKQIEQVLADMRVFAAPK